MPDTYNVVLHGWLDRDIARVVAEKILASNPPPGVTVTIEPGDLSMRDRVIETVERSNEHDRDD